MLSPPPRTMDWGTAAALHRWFYATRWGWLISRGGRARLRSRVPRRPLPAEGSHCGRILVMNFPRSKAVASAELVRVRILAAQARTTAAFQQRHGRPMPDDNVWIAQRRAEQQALARLINTMKSAPGRAVQGTGCGAAAAGPVPLDLDLTRHLGTTVSRRVSAESMVLGAVGAGRAWARSFSMRPRSSGWLADLRITGGIGKSHVAQALGHLAVRHGAAVRFLIKRGEPISFQAVQREAGVSHAFLSVAQEAKASR
jgi:hypothetical protein